MAYWWQAAGADLDWQNTYEYPAELQPVRHYSQWDYLAPEMQESYLRLIKHREKVDLIRKKRGF